MKQRRHRAWLPHHRHQRQRRHSEARQGEVERSFTRARPGRYAFECTRMCGAGHHFMRGELIVRDPSAGSAQMTHSTRASAFWLAGLRAAAAIATTLVAGGQERASSLAIRFPGSRRRNSRNSGWASRISRRSKPPRTGWGPRSTATSCAACHTCRRSAAPPRLETRAAYRGATGAFDARTRPAIR